MKKYGYIRVSTQEQNEERQVIALASFEIPKRNLYIDKKSGKDFARPAYQRLMRRLKKGDLLLVKSIDRLGRNYADIIEQWRVITKEIGADIRVLDMPMLDTTYGKDLLGTFIADLVLQVMSFTAQIERDNIRQRQAEGIAAAKSRGEYWGGTQKHLPENFDELYARWQNGEMNSTQLAALCDMNPSTLFRKLRSYRNK